MPASRIFAALMPLHASQLDGIHVHVSNLKCESIEFREAFYASVKTSKVWAYSHHSEVCASSASSAGSQPKHGRGRGGRREPLLARGRWQWRWSNDVWLDRSPYLALHLCLYCEPHSGARSSSALTPATPQGGYAWVNFMGPCVAGAIFGFSLILSEL